LDHFTFSPLGTVGDKAYKAALKMYAIHQINMQQYAAFETFPTCNPVHTKN
jgi:hypothetical protein